ncbi:MAG: chloride channel protein [Thermodesulfobacteriota bacterium]|nr:MAG: chloride channel protein [Thermodesulfobacteriota bacterium]
MFKRIIKRKFLKKYWSSISAPATMMLGFSVLVGASVGLAYVIFRWLISFFIKFFFTDIQGYLSYVFGHFSIILIPVAGAILFSPLIYYFSRESKGHGIPDVIIAMETKGGRIRPIVGFIKSISSAICIGSGGSAGAEGPVVQIGASIGSALGQLFHMSEERVKNLVACGAAGGIAAAFNAPIGGLFYALEVVFRDFSARRISNVVLASVSASVVADIFLGNERLVTLPSYAIHSPVELLFYIILGIIIIPFSIIFIRGFYGMEDYFDRLKVHALYKPVIGALLLGFIGFFFPQVFGIGYENIRGALNSTIPFSLMLILIPLKLLAVFLTLGSGGSGGLFTPSLVLGALVGGAFGSVLAVLFPHMVIEPGAYALVGMAAFFAGSSRAPMTAFLILFELTGDYFMILPLMLAVAITTIGAEWFQKESIDTLKVVRLGINLNKEMIRDILESIRVKEILGKETSSVKPSATIDEIVTAVEKENRGTITVVDDNGEFRGIIPLSEIITILKNKDALMYVVVAEDLVKDVPCLDESESLQEALRKFVESGSDVLPVIRVVDSYKKLSGIILKHDILSAYRREMSVRKG